MVSANLARTLAEREQTIFLVDADLRHPSVGKIFDIDSDVGLDDLLSSRKPMSTELLGQAIQPVESPSLFVIVNGAAVPNPTALLSTPTMAQLVRNLKTQGQTTLLDAPHVLGMADVSILAPIVDGVVLVVRQGVTKRERLLAAIRQVQETGPRELALVFVQKDGRNWS